MKEYTMTTQDKKGSTAKNPRKVRAVKVITAVPTLVVDTDDVAVSKSNSITAFLKSVLGNLSQTSVHCHSNDVMAINGYNLVVTDIYNEIKEALNNSESAFYRDIASGSGDFGIVYISTEHGTHLFFLAGAKDQPLPENDGNLQQIINLLSSYQGFNLGTIKGRMVDGYLEKANAMARQKENSNSALSIDMVDNEPTRIAFDLVHNAIKEELKKYLSLRAYFTHFKAASNTDEWYSVMFTTNFELMADILKSGKDTSFTEGTVKANYPYGIGRVVGIKDRKFVNCRFIVIGIDKQYMPMMFSDSEKAFLKQAYTEVKWKIPSEVRTELRNDASRIYQSEDKGDKAMEENQVPVNEVQGEAIPEESPNYSKRIAMARVVLDIFCNSKSTMLWEANIKISQNLDYAEQGYNILVVNDVDAFTDILVDQKNVCSLDTNIIGTHVAMGMATKDDIVVMFYIVDKTHELASAVDSRDLTINGCIDSYMRHVGASHADNMASLNQHFQQKNAKAVKVESTDPVPVEKPTTRKIMSMPTNPIGEAPRYRPLLEEYGMREPEHVVNARYDRFTFATSIDEDLNKYSLYLHPTHCVTSLENLLEAYKAYSNMPAIPVVHPEDFQPLCRLQNGRVYWNRFALLSDHSVQTNKKDFKGVNQYVLHLHDHNNHSFVIAVYADFTKRKRPAMVYNVYEILKAGETPFNCGGISRDVFQYLMQIMGAM